MSLGVIQLLVCPRALPTNMCSCSTQPRRRPPLIRRLFLELVALHPSHPVPTIANPSPANLPPNPSPCCCIPSPTSHIQQRSHNNTTTTATTTTNNNNNNVLVVVTDHTSHPWVQSEPCSILFPCWLYPRETIKRQSKKGATIKQRVVGVTPHFLKQKHLRWPRPTCCLLILLSSFDSKK